MPANLIMIRQAMQDPVPKMIQFMYTKQGGITETYMVEPYEIDEMTGVFWGFKTNDMKPGIRKFFLHAMMSEQLLPNTFVPRWPLYPFGKM